MGSAEEILANSADSDSVQILLHEVHGPRAFFLHDHLQTREFHGVLGVSEGHTSLADSTHPSPPLPPV